MREGEYHVPLPSTYVFIFSDLLKPSESEMTSNNDDPYHVFDLEAIVDSQGDSQHDNPPAQLKKCSHFFHKSCFEV